MTDKTAEPEASEWDQDLANEPLDDPTAVIRFAGCAIQQEIDELASLGVKIS